LMLTTRGNPAAESTSLAVVFYFGEDVQPTMHLRGGWEVSINGSHSSAG
jgi:hypothetical protein